MLDFDKALEALNNAQVSAKRTSDFTSNIVELFKSAANAGRDSLSCSEVLAMYNAATGDSKTIKNISDRCWVLSNKNKNNAHPVLSGTETIGVYRLA